MNNLYLENILSPDIIRMLNDNKICYSVSEQDGRHIAELEFWSKHDGDQIEDIWFDKDNCDKSFDEEFKRIANNWDVDEFVEIWLDAKHSRPSVCNLSARQLVSDGICIKRFLKSVSKQIQKVTQYGLHHIHYNLSVDIDPQKQQETTVFTSQ